MLAAMTPAGRCAVLFVCTGNYCRSPTAEAVFAALVAAQQLADRIHVDSAGTHDYHVDEPPDPRTQAHARRRGYELAHLRGRQLEARDFEHFDLILVMDQANLADLRVRFPDHPAHKVRYFLEWAPETGRQEVPDPFYGEARDFELVLDLVEAGARGLLAHLRP